MVSKSTVKASDLRHPPMSQQQQQRPPRLLAFLSLLAVLLSLLPPSSAVDLLFNGFASSDLSLYANATLELPPNATSAAELRRNYLSLTAPSAFTLGRALLPSPIPTKSASSSSAFSSVLAFYASFVFSIAPVPGILPGHGLAFLFAPAAGTLGAVSSQHIGLFNRSTDGDRSSHVLAVEFDVFQNEEFKDINDNHVGVDYNSLTSIAAQPAGYWKDDDGGNTTFVNLTLNDGSNYQVWVDYSGDRLNVTMAPAGTRKPRRTLISIEINLSDLFLDEMHVGFCASTGRLVERHRILAWSFSNSNSSAADGLITSNLPNFIPPPQSGTQSRRRLFASLVTVAGVVLLTSTVVAVLLVVLHRRRKTQQQDEEGGGFEETIEEWEKEYWPHRIGYQELLNATHGFSDRNLIANGGNGRVYKGVLADGADVAVKVFSHSNEEEETKQFVAEVSSLGRLKHRNLVGLRGWCRAHRRDGSGDATIIVYDYMENGNLDQRIFSTSKPLDWGARVRILKDVAAAVLYLHEGWGEAVVLHRDIKASNVLLDGEMTARLGDFGLARSHPRGRALETTRVVGSAGYLAPEVVLTGRPTAASDVYALGVLALELVSGRPAGDGCTPLVTWVRAAVDAGAPEAAVDMRVRGAEGFDEWEAERVVAVGLLCTSGDQALRPTMRQVVRLLEMDNEKEKVGARGQLGESAKAAQSLDARLREAPTAGPDKAVWGLVAARRREEKGERRHLAFEELRLSMSCSTSLSGSDLILEGR